MSAITQALKLAAKQPGILKKIATTLNVKPAISEILSKIANNDIAKFLAVNTAIDAGFSFAPDVLDAANELLDANPELANLVPNFGRTVIDAQTVASVTVDSPIHAEATSLTDIEEFRPMFDALKTFESKHGSLKSLNALQLALKASPADLAMYAELRKFR